MIVDTIGAGFEVPDDTVIWRYMSLGRFNDLLRGEFYFAAAHQFEDQFEGAITDAQASRRREQAKHVYPGDEAAQLRQLKHLSWAFGDLRRMTKINCWHARAAENTAMWERYLRDQPGVAIASTAGALKAALHPFRLAPHYGKENIFVAGIRYIDYVREDMDDSQCSPSSFTSAASIQTKPRFEQCCRCGWPPNSECRSQPMGS